MGGHILPKATTTALAVTAILGALAGCSASPSRPAAAAPAHTSAAATSPPVPTFTCAAISSDLRPVITDMRKQTALEKEADGTLSTSSLAGAWTPPGTYSSDLNSLMNSITGWAEANTSDSQDDIIIDGLPSSVRSQPASLASDANALYSAGGWIYSPSSSNPATAYWGSFESSLRALAADCKP